MFILHNQLAALDVPICKSIEFGTCENGVYSLQSWINGEDLKDVMPRLSESEQYVLGLKAGKILRKIHSIPLSETHIDFWTALPPINDWAVRFNHQLDNDIDEYHESGLRFDSDIVWSVKYSPHFATGQVRGYFGGNPPEEFWGLLALYISDYLLTFWKNQPITNDFWHDITMGLSQNVLKWFDNMTNPKPSWYLDDVCVMQKIDDVTYKLKERAYG